MSAQQPPGPQELIDELGISPEEAQMIADAMTPLQDATGVGSSVGSALTGVDAPGPQLVGTMLEHMAMNVNLASTSVETLARALDFYLEAQVGTLDDLFPPPDQLVERAGDDIMPLVEAIDRLSENPP